MLLIGLEEEDFFVIKSDLIQLIAKRHPQITQKQANQIVDLFFEEIIKALEQGKRVELRGFGSFSLRKRAGRTGRNPKTGEKIYISEKSIPVFKLAKSFNKELNSRTDDE